MTEPSKRRVLFEVYITETGLVEVDFSPFLGYIKPSLIRRAIKSISVKYRQYRKKRVIAERKKQNVGRKETRGVSGRTAEAESATARTTPATGSTEK